MNTPAFACASLPETASKHQRSSGRHGLGNDQLRAENSMTAAWMAQWQLFYMGQGWANHAEETLATVREYALKAVKLDPDNAEALGIYAHCCAYGDRDFDTAIKCFERASLLNPSLAFNWALSAMTYCHIGNLTSPSSTYKDTASLSLPTSPFHGLNRSTPSPTASSFRRVPQ
jgi:tetratricopeptide (TPR) repeat protein